MTHCISCLSTLLLALIAHGRILPLIQQWNCEGLIIHGIIFFEVITNVIVGFVAALLAIYTFIDIRLQ
jgi:hypothetical protein